MKWSIVSFAIVFTSLAGCQVREHAICIENCPVIDAPMADAGPDGTGMDSGPPPDACIPTGAEACDGLDNDCDMMVDELPINGVGDNCSNNNGECTAGVTQCVNGDIECSGVLPSFEICDNLDNDCDNATDENNPGGNTICGQNEGECQTGVTNCQAGGNLVCVGEVGPATETCDGLDNDCDSMFDEGVPPGGSCGTTDVGECTLGMQMCIGGSMQCVGATGPSLEQCDALDHDCDGDPLNGYNLSSDVQNCGSCGNVCMLNNAVEVCSNSTCEVAVCEPTYWDVDMVDANGCEYGPCTKQSEQEACNGVDDNCNNQIDENLSPPAICDPHGECAPGGNAIDPTCMGAGGWDCVYPGTVETDVNGDIAPETLCDGLDNDCDQAIDEGDPDVGNSCNDGNNGVCRGTGTFQCAANPADPVECVITTPGQPASAEICDGIDNDCDGNVDEGADTGALHDWVSIGGFEIFAYEASRRDASSNSSGVSTVYPCSKAGVRPWTNVTAPDAEAACQAIGARLCTESEWETACEAGSSCLYSYGSNCSTYDGDKCNGADNDADPGTGGTQNATLATGSEAQCYADWGAAGDVFDMSGNVKEWTAPRSAGVNPQRGGANNTPAGGMQCGYDFLVADDSFFFPSVGFRCCR